MLCVIGKPVATLYSFHRLVPLAPSLVRRSMSSTIKSKPFSVVFLSLLYLLILLLSSVLFFFLYLSFFFFFFHIFSSPLLFAVSFVFFQVFHCFPSLHLAFLSFSVVILVSVYFSLFQLFLFLLPLLLSPAISFLFLQICNTLSLLYLLLIFFLSCYFYLFLPPPSFSCISSFTCFLLISYSYFLVSVYISA